MKWEGEQMGKRTKEEEAKAEEANGEQRRKNQGKQMKPQAANDLILLRAECQNLTVRF